MKCYHITQENEINHLYKKFKINDTIVVTGRPGTNGTLKHGELYNVEEITEENENREIFYYASQPVVVLDDKGRKVKPFLGKFE